MLYNKEGLGYMVVSEVIINGVDVLLIGESVESICTTVYQVVRGGGVELNTLDIMEAKTLFNEYVKELLLIKLTINTL
jgi:hypothetical protein